MDEMDEPGTEQATPRKRARARRAGRVARSPDLGAATGLLALLGTLAWAGPRALHALRELMLRGLRAAAEPSPSASLPVSLREPALQAAWPLLGALLAIALGAWLAGFLQVGPLLAGGALGFDARRLDPARRLRAMLSADALLSALLAACKLGLLLALGAYLLARDLRGLFALPAGSAPRALGVLALAVQSLALRLALAAALLGLADLALRRVRHARQLRMSRRELGEELRESHGPVELRERRARLLQQARAQIALSELAQASVLLLDASGRAVALAFDPADASQRAPRLLAKAQGALCSRLRARAEQDGVPVRFEPALVALLFRLELTEQVPPASYVALAAIFAGLGAQQP